MPQKRLYWLNVTMPTGVSSPCRMEEPAITSRCRRPTSAISTAAVTPTPTSSTNATQRPSAWPSGVPSATTSSTVSSSGVYGVAAFAAADTPSFITKAWAGGRQRGSSSPSNQQSVSEQPAMFDAYRDSSLAGSGPRTPRSHSMILSVGTFPVVSTSKTGRRPMGVERSLKAISSGM